MTAPLEIIPADAIDIRPSFRALPDGRRAPARFRLATALALGLLTFYAPAARGREAHEAAPPGYLHARSPLAFEPNLGQADSAAPVLAHGPGYTLELSASGVVLNLSPPRRPPAPPAGVTGPPAPPSRVHLRLLGANAAANLEPVRPLPGVVNYYLGDDPARWRTGIPTFARAVAGEVYRGVDLVYYGTDGQLEYDFVVAPGADPNRIALAFASDGSEAPPAVTIDADGALRLELPHGSLLLRAPVVYQEDGGRRQAVPGRFVVAAADSPGESVAGPSNDAVVRFALGDYDRTRPLVIDPVLLYSTFLGTPSGNDSGHGVAVDAAGNTYVTGHRNPYEPWVVSSRVAKLSADSGAVLYETIFGGQDYQWGQSVAVDKDGNAYVVGQTMGSTFPGSPVPSNGDYEVYVAKFDPTGKQVYGMLLGGSDDDWAGGIAVDSEGRAWVSGSTTSGNPVFPTPTPTHTTARTGTASPEPTATPTYTPKPEKEFPTTGDALQKRMRGIMDAFVTRLNKDGTGIEYSTYLGGDGMEGAGLGPSLALGRDGAVYVTGNSYRPYDYEGDTLFPTTVGAYQRNYRGHPDIFVTKLDAEGGLAYSTLLGGSTGSHGNGIAVDARDEVYVVGRTGDKDFPLSASPLQAYSGGLQDAFLIQLSATLGVLRYGTYLGGAGGWDNARSVAVDDNGVVYVTGETDSPTFPVRDPFSNGPGALCAKPSGYDDCTAAFVLSLRPGGTGAGALISSTLVGGSESDHGEGIAVGPGGVLHVAGTTESANFPLAGQPPQPTFGPGVDAFVLRVSGAGGPPPPTSTPTRTEAATRTQTRTATATGTTTLTATVTLTATATLVPTDTPTATPSRTRTPSRTPTATFTTTPTATATPRCGDNKVDREAPHLEDCDDGNTQDGDACPSTCKFKILLQPRLILGKGFCADAPQQLEVYEVGGPEPDRNIAADPDITYQWLDGPNEPALLKLARTKVVDYLRSKVKDLPEIPTAQINVQDGRVFFGSQDAGIGVNVLRARRQVGPDTYYESNLALVIGGLKFVKAGSLEIEPESLATSLADIVSEALTRTFGTEVPDPPLILFTEGPFCSANGAFFGTTGSLQVKSIKFDLLGGLVTDADLMGAVDAGIGLIPDKNPLGRLAQAVARKLAPAFVAQFLDFEVSSEAAKESEKKGSSRATQDDVIQVTDSLSAVAPFFKGLVSARAPGLSAVQATLDLEDYCIGKASDSAIVWVGPRLEHVEIRNEQRLLEDPAELRVNQSRTLSAVTFFNAFRDGGEPVELPFDPIGIPLDQAPQLLPLIDAMLPGSQKLLAQEGGPVEWTYPSDAQLTNGVYRGGGNYFRLKFSWDRSVPSLTINELQLQTTVPNWPIVTDWSMPVPPNPPTPVAAVDPSAGVLTGARRGNGQVKVDVCLPFLSGEFVSEDINGVRVSASDLLVRGVVYDDVEGNGTRDTLDPPLAGWTVEVLSGIGTVLATGTTNGDGEYEFSVPEERLPVGLQTFGIRERPPAGWSPVHPAGGTYSGLPIQFLAPTVQDFGNFADVSVTGRKFDDRNGNRSQDADELGLPGWTIEFVDRNGGIRRTTTGGDGSYLFRVPFAAFADGGTATVREVPQDDWVQTFPSGDPPVLPGPGKPLQSGMTLEVNFGNRALTSTPTRTGTRPPTSTPTPTFTRTPTVTQTETATPTATRTALAVIAGHLFADADADAKRDPEENGLAGWTAFFDDNGDGRLNNAGGTDGVCDGQAREVCVRADDNGRYGLPVFGIGVYTVRDVIRPGWEPTTEPPSDVVIVRAGQSVDGIDFGRRRDPLEAGKVGDCNGDARVGIAELVQLLSAARGQSPSLCPGADDNADGRITGDELVRAIYAALKGMPVAPEPTPADTTSPTGTATPTDTAVPTASATRSATPRTPSPTPPPSATATVLPSSTRTTAPSTTPGLTATRSPTATKTPSGTPTATAGMSLRLCDSLSAPAFIPDASPAGIANTIVIPPSTGIADVDVSLFLSHTWVGDLSVTLEHVETGTVVTLFDRPGRPAFPNGCPGEDVDVVLDDAATDAVQSACDDTIPSISGRKRPLGRLADFAGQDAAGSWTLRVSDNFEGDAGALFGWCLDFNAASPAGQGAGASQCRAGPGTGLDE